jgi:hypothetical protein
MSVRAKFYVSEITKRAYNPDHVTVLLSPVTRGGDDNKEWAAATPSGKVEMQINNPSAAKQFDQWMIEKRDIYITFDAVPKEEAP